MTAILSRDAHDCGLGASEVHHCVAWPMGGARLVGSGRRAAVVRLDDGLLAHGIGPVGGLVDERGLVPVCRLDQC
jgi:hypothetical protein